MEADWVKKEQKNMYKKSISKEAIQKILGLGGNLCATPEEMIEKVKVTFFPIVSEGTSPEVKIL